MSDENIYQVVGTVINPEDFKEGDTVKVIHTFKINKVHGDNVFTIGLNDGTSLRLRTGENGYDSVYLLSHRPDPDLEAKVALKNAFNYASSLNSDGSKVDPQDILVYLRAKGLDVVKVEK